MHQTEVEIYIGPDGKGLFAPFKPSLKRLANALAPDDEELPSVFCG